MIRALGILVFLAFALALHPNAEAEAKEIEKGLSRGSVLLSWFKDAEMDFQLLRSLGADVAGGGAAGEIFVTAKGITDGNPASWSAAFLALGERLEADGNARLERGHKVSAMESLLRAAGTLVEGLNETAPTYSYAALFGESKDSLPYMGEDPEQPEVFIICGLGGNGTVYSAIASDIALAWMQGKKPRKAAQLFRIGR